MVKMITTFVRKGIRSRISRRRPGFRVTPKKGLLFFGALVLLGISVPKALSPVVHQVCASGSVHMRCLA